jgi:hypothetical protein
MRRKEVLFAIVTMLGSICTGCKSHQVKVADLQNEYDQLAKQFQRDCSGEYLDVPPKISPKCKEEDAKMKAAWDRLQAERTKQ